MDIVSFSGNKIQKIGVIYSRTLEANGAKHSAEDINKYNSKKKNIYKLL